MHGLTILGLLLVFSIIIQLLGWEPGPLNNYGKPQEYENKWERERIAKEVEKAEREAFLMELRENNRKFCSKINNPDADYQSESIKSQCGTR